MTVRQWLKGIGDDMAMARRVQLVWDEGCQMALEGVQAHLIRTPMEPRNAAAAGRPGIEAHLDGAA